MKGKSLFFMLILWLGGANGADFSLSKMLDSDYVRLTKKIQIGIEPDNTGFEIRPFDKAQSFSIFQKDSDKKGYFIPVIYNSKKYKNTICRLYYFPQQGEIKYIDVFAEKNEEEEIVATCVAVAAVSLWSDKGNTYYLMIIRFRVGNVYKDTGVAVQYKKDSLLFNRKINDCIAKIENIATIPVLRKRTAACKGI